MVDPALVELFNQGIALAQAQHHGAARERYIGLLSLHAQQNLVAEPAFLATTKLMIAYTAIDLGDLPLALHELSLVDAYALDLPRRYDLHFTRGNVLGGLGRLRPMFEAFVEAISVSEDLDDYDQRPQVCWSKILGVSLAASDWSFLEEVARKAHQAASLRGMDELRVQAAVCLAEAHKHRTPVSPRVDIAATATAIPAGTVQPVGIEPAPAPDADAELLVLDGAAAGRTLTFGAAIRVGGTEDCDFYLPGCTAQATIGPDGTAYRLRATGDVFLGGVAVTDVSLASISMLVIGGVSVIAQKRSGTYVSKPIIHSAPDPAPPFVTAGAAVTEVGTLIHPRADAGLAMIGADHVLVAGGAPPQRGEAFSTVEMFQLSTGTCVELPLAHARTSPAIATLPDGKLLLAGGRTRTAEIFDPLTQGSVETGSLQVARTGAATLVLPNGLVVVLGGLAKPDALSAEVYDPAKAAWGGLRSPSFAIAQAAPLDATRFLIAATGGSGPPRPPASFFIFDSRTWRFDPVPPPEAPRWAPRLCALGDGRVLVLCGYPRQHVRTAEVFDLATKSFTRLPDMLSHRDTPAITRVHSGRVLVVGGRSLSEGSYSAEMFDPATRLWTALPAIPRGLNPVGALPHPDGSAIVVSFRAVSRVTAPAT